MSDVAIKVKDLKKTFRIYDKAADRLKEMVFLGRRKFHHDFNALENISFEIKKGEFIGIVGRNGAGKSTLLKLLSRELTPTSGSVEIQGSVSLLQLGAGFDKELTGYENAKFSCQIQGMRPAEIESALKEIDKFADIGEFFFHPVRTYSSGMYSRLSFACAVNVNPDILIVDEVLSVGDMAFSQKCFRKMREFKLSGKTVVFVSHDTETISAFCDKALWIKDGLLLQYGEARKVAESYKSYMLYGPVSVGTTDQPGIAKASPAVAPQEDGWVDLAKNPLFDSGKAIISHFALFDLETGGKAIQLEPGKSYKLRLKLKLKEAAPDAYFGWMLYDKHGMVALHSNNIICGKLFQFSEGESFVAYFTFELPSLNTGEYIFSVGVGNGDQLWCRVQDVYPISVIYRGPKSQQCGYMVVVKEEVGIE